MRSRQTLSFLLVVLLCACGGTKTSYLKDAKKSLNVAYAVTKKADETFSKWSAHHQQQIVERASSREEAEEKLAAFRDERQPVLKAFSVAYTAIGSVAAAVPLVEQGLKEPRELTPLLFAALKAANDVRAAIEALQGEKP